MDKQISDALAQAYFKKFMVRVDILSEFQKRKAYSDVIREGQEALELFIKGLLRHLGADPTFSHDPGKELLKIKPKIPDPWSRFTHDLVSWSKKLRRERELSFYGASDFIPTEEYSKEDAAETIVFLQKVSSTLSHWSAFKVITDAKPARRKE